MNKPETIQTINNTLTNEADYIVFAGKDRNTSRPEAANTLGGACAIADKLAKSNNYVQVVYMPEDKIDTNETVLEILNGKIVIGGAK